MSELFPAGTRERFADMLLSTAKKVIVLLIGGTLLGIGIAMIVLPGPAFVVIPIGLSILGTEFAWARAFLKRVRQHAGNFHSQLTIGKKKRSTIPQRAPEK